MLYWIILQERKDKKLKESGLCWLRELLVWVGTWKDKIRWLKNDMVESLIKGE